GIPPLLADMTLLSYRYLFEMGDDLRRMQIATRLRGFEGRKLNAHTLRTYAALAGSLLVRSYERSERIYQAMVLRGYGTDTRVQHEWHATAFDNLLLGIIIFVAAGFVGFQFYLA
ncbi:MAG: cobalt ECF transporter T component CbiQ, partial [Okeania sp. SIO3B3]|nr:cobalt ECF transporter T component CbiQ [Okeania sp. SIO3B3]